MPDASHRIRDTTIKAINNMLVMFNSLDERVDISFHPKYHIIFNNVSRYGDNYDLFRIVVISVPADIVEYDMIFRMERNINSLIKAVEHHEHVVDSFDGGISDAVRGIWH